MSVTLKTFLVLGVKLSELIEKTERKVTRYDSETGKPYQKNITEFWVLGKKTEEVNSFIFDDMDDIDWFGSLYIEDLKRAFPSDWEDRIIVGIKIGSNSSLPNEIQEDSLEEAKKKLTSFFKEHLPTRLLNPRIFLVEKNSY